jgi:hypothetical protein
MVVPDAYRAQLYLRRLTVGLEDLTAALSRLGVDDRDAHAALEGLARSLARELDSILLPTVALELAVARQLSLSTGATPGERYGSFFATAQGWQPWVRSILPRYGFLDEVIGAYVDMTVAAVREALGRLAADLDNLRRSFLDRGESRLCGVGLAEGGDRHRKGRRVLWFRFERGTTVMYKPTDLRTYRLFHRFVGWLDLDPAHACYLPRVLARDGYGWMEFVPHVGCGDERDVKRFFLRAGVLLAVAESLNLVDGHADNLVARGPHPVVVDLETLLHNHSRPPTGGESGILGTLLVQRPPPARSRLGITAGLMRPPSGCYEQLATVVEHERTDKLSAAYGRPAGDAPHHLPRVGDDCVPVHDYVDDVVAGYADGYEAISHRLRSARGIAGWLREAAGARPRIVVRPTMYYAYLLRRLQQPEA